MKIRDHKSALILLQDCFKENRAPTAKEADDLASHMKFLIREKRGRDLMQAWMVMQRSTKILYEVHPLIQGDLVEAVTKADNDRSGSFFKELQEAIMMKIDPVSLDLVEWD
jgi:hypothetical protein